MKLTQGLRRTGCLWRRNACVTIFKILIYKGKRDFVYPFLMGWGIERPGESCATRLVKFAGGAFNPQL